MNWIGSLFGEGVKKLLGDQRRERVTPFPVTPSPNKEPLYRLYTASLWLSSSFFCKLLEELKWIVSSRMIVFGSFTDYSLWTVIIRLHIYLTDCRVAYMSQQGFTGYFPYFKSQDMVRRSKRRLNKNINVHCLSFLKTYKRFLTQGQFRNVMFETVFLNKSCCGGRKVRTIKFVVRHIGYWDMNMHN